MEQVMQFVSNHPVLSIAWVGLLVAVIFMTLKTATSKVKDISNSDLTRLINSEDAVVVDTRTIDEFRKGHIVGAINLTPTDIKNGTLAVLDKHKDRPVIVLCANGTSSKEPAEALVKEGFTQVFTLKNGLSGWSGENLPLVRGK
ncbi:rhodanese-like domain-containing protein [Budviciaceae bacterium CWB-B4]|uniref:Rhodanese-like domain-containing protein n=1 Tax=Limnobaculum xujianqingii TaxID=2738837 RepID=A0A9D7AKB8_9GAMM|nr:rhodanese-like domain-containing protein [Limnobaculum xujianqingii]MBK5074202.1 rhodanese-like domain-containing protein [Limnobaculum xujianqingii]MBK5177511.1 rhodanese-like domain-containing protein [Limnobaculum xujianqingii]